MAMSMASDITERNQKQEALKQKTKELQEYYDLMIGRELKMVELKKEVNELMRKLGNTDKYEI
jgi:predicted RNase H-like nuclease (RuvC/YqgF family)